MEDKLEQFIEFLEEDDEAFLDQLLENLTDEELSGFFENNPDFLSDKE